MKRTSIYWPILLQTAFFLVNGTLAAQSVQELQTSFDASRSKGDIKAAVPFAEKIILVLEQQRITDTTIYIKKLLQLSRTYLNASRSEEAEKCSLKALAVARPNDPQYADALIEWSASIGSQGEYERADSIAQLAIDLRKILLGKDNIHYCGALLAAGAWQFQGGYTTKAINTLEECRSLWKKNNFDKPNLLVETLNYLGSCYYTVGKSTEAEMCFKEALAVRASFSGTNDNYFEDKIAFVEKSNLALILIDNGRYTEADEILSTIESNLFEEGLWEDVAYSDIYALKAKLLSAVNKNEEAIAAAKKGKAMVIKAFGPNNPYVFQYDNLMGMDLIQLGKPAEAIALYRASLDSMKVLGGENWVEYAGMTAVLPVCYINQHDYNKAIELYLESVAYYESLGEGYELDLKQMYFGLVEAYMYTKNYAESAKYLEKFKSILVPDNLMDRGARILQAKLAYFGKNYASVTPDVNNYVQTLTKQISAEIFLFDDQKRQSQAKDLQSVTNDLCAFIQADAHQKKMPKLIEIAIDFQLFTKSILLTATQKIRADILNGNDQTQKQSYAKWINQKEELAYYYTFPKAELVDQNIDLAQLEARADSLEKVLARNNAAYNHTTKNLATNWQTIRLALRPGEAALEIVRYQGQLQQLSDEVHYAIFILSPELTEPVVLFIQDGEELEQVLLEKHLSACTSTQSTAPGSDLYNAVWKNIEPYVKNAKTIFVAADGCFHKINFASLRQPDNTYLADRYSFQPVFSLKDILKEPGTVVASRSAFLLGNPTFSSEKNTDANTASRSRAIEDTAVDTTDYAVYNPLGILRDLNATRGIELKLLPGSQKEVEDLSALLQRNGWQTTLYTGTMAREEEVKSLRSPRIMHLATHGYFLANERAGTAGLSRETVVRNPLLRSMLFFAGAQNTLDKKNLDQKDDGILTAYEVQNMNLDGTELVVLSACKTGQGKVQNGEGVYGLQRALRIAGAQNLLLSLWDVDDEVGRTFMQTFYEQWLGGKSKPEAFRYTQLAIKAKYPHPFYWAGFILIGN